MGLGGWDRDSTKVKGVDSGGTDREITAIQDGSIWRLAMDNPVEVTATPGCPVFSSKYRVVSDKTGATLNTSTYSTVYSYSGTGKFVGFVADFSASNVIIKFTIDSDVIFDLDADDIVNIMYPEGPGASGMRSTAGGPIYNAADKKIFFTPDCPIKYGTTVKIEAKASSGTPTVTWDAVMVTLTKET